MYSRYPLATIMRTATWARSARMEAISFIISVISIGSVEFEVTVTDNREVDYVKFYVGQIVTLYSGTDYFGIGDQYKISHWFYSWDDAGTYDVEVEAYDKKGNSSSKTYSYYYPGN